MMFLIYAYVKQGCEVMKKLLKSKDIRAQISKILEYHDLDSLVN